MSDDEESRLRIGYHRGGTLWAVKKRDGLFVMLDQVKIAERRVKSGSRWSRVGMLRGRLVVTTS
jgi:hypothetical protein